jgi:thiol:disulfide interchange protein DsbA
MSSGSPSTTKPTWSPLARPKVDSAKLVDALKSFGTATKARQAKQLAETYRIDSVPSLYVQGRYTTSVAAAGSQQQMLLVLDELIAKVRKAG